MFICFIIFLVFSLSITSGLALSTNTKNKDIVTGKVNTISKDKYDSFHDVQINVYSLVLSNTFEYGNEYDHIFAFSVTPNKYGEFSFSRPSDYCFVQIEASSVSEGFGIAEGDIVLHPTDRTVTLSISKIDSFEYDVKKERPIFTDCNDNQLQVKNNYILSIKEDNFDTQDLQAICILDEIEYKTTIELSDMSEVEKIDFLYENNIISEEERIHKYCDLAEMPIEDLSEDYTQIMSTLCDYSQTANSNLKSRINTIAETARVNYDNEETYTRGFFTIHYESGEFSLEELQSIYSTLNFAKASLCFTYSFRTPDLEQGQTTYNVYLVGTTEGNHGVTYGWYNNGIPQSYIVAYINQTDEGINVIDDYAHGVFVHEFMHAVQCAYDSRGKYTTDYNYYKEATATLASEVLWDNPDISYFVNQFLSSPEYSLFDNATGTVYENRAYGAMLYPYYLFSEYSTLNTIREIFENFELESTETIYEAIDNVLLEEGDSFVDSYVTFTEKVYDVHGNFDSHLEWDDTTKKTTLSSSSCSYTLPKLATMYFEDVAPITGRSVCTFTFGLNSGTDASQVNLRSIYTSPTGTTSVTNRTFKNGVRTVIVSLDTNAKICFLMSNVTIDSNVSFFASETKNYT